MLNCSERERDSESVLDSKKDLKVKKNEKFKKENFLPEGSKSVERKTRSAKERDERGEDRLPPAKESYARSNITVSFFSIKLKIEKKRKFPFVFGNKFNFLIIKNNNSKIN